MTKEPHQTPKAVNIIRPSSNYGLLHNTTSTSSSGSSNSGSLLQKRTGSITSSTTRKLRVNSTTTKPEKPLLNLYHPPTRKPSYDDYHRITVTRPPIEIYKPHQQRLTKSFTSPSLSNEHTQPIQPTTRPISRASRSVLGPINTPVAITTNHIEKPQDNLIDRIDDKSILDKTIESDDSEEDEDEDEDEEEEDDDDDDDNENDPENDDEDEDEDDNEEDEPVINEARVNRKIADLELSINSLLTVNAMLESTVRKQASQLSQMKSKMMSGESIDALLDEVPIVDVHDNTDENDEEDWDKDVLFQKLRKITEQMIEQGQKSIDFEYKILGRVLSNYPQQEEEEDEEEEGEEGEKENTLPSPSSTSLNNKSPTHASNNTQIPATSIPLIAKSSKIAKKKNNI